MEGIQDVMGQKTIAPPSTAQMDWSRCKGVPFKAYDNTIILIEGIFEFPFSSWDIYIFDANFGTFASGQKGPF